MEATNRSALKEWAAIERIMARGSSCLMLRKGGIWERKAGFEVEHREFWLFPTHFHQNPHELTGGYGWALEEARELGHDPDHVRIEHYALVEDAYRVEDLDALYRLSGLHPLQPSTVESRFHYRGKQYLHVLVTRLFRLPEPRVIANTLDYEGCVSWVELDDPLPTDALAPVLGDEEFARIRADVADRLGRGPAVSRV